MRHGRGEIILERKARTEELGKFLENIENKTIVLEPTTIIDLSGFNQFNNFPCRYGLYSP